MKPDGKPFDGPVITTGVTPGASPGPAPATSAPQTSDRPASTAQQAASGMTAAPAPAATLPPWGGDQPSGRNGQPQAKRPGQSPAGQRHPGQGYEARPGKPAFVHVLAVLAISALGIVPLALMMKSSIDNRISALELTVKVPTKIDVVNGTVMGYLAGMVVVLLGVALVYRKAVGRRR